MFQAVKLLIDSELNRQSSLEFSFQIIFILIS